MWQHIPFLCLIACQLLPTFAKVATNVPTLPTFLKQVQCALTLPTETKATPLVQGVEGVGWHSQLPVSTNPNERKMEKSNIVVMDGQQLEETLFSVLGKFFTEREEQASANVVEDRNLERWEVCDRYHISKGTLNNWVNRGLVKPMRLGRRVLFPMSELLRAESEGLRKFQR